MNNYTWTEKFRGIYDVALSKYSVGNRQIDTYFDQVSLDFLASIGCRPIELYDFAEDARALSYETALLITAVRRDYFLTIQHGQWTGREVKEEDFPEKTDAIDGIEWLPRIIVKATARLRGKMPSDFMYCCGGDRRFLGTHNIHPADFLRVVWSANDDPSKIIQFVKTGQF